MTKPADYSPSGQPIYRYEAKEQEWHAPTFGEGGWGEKIEAHVEAYFGPVTSVFHEIMSDRIHLDVHYIKPTPKRNYHTFFTTGMSYLPMSTPEGLEDHRYAELLICLPPEWPVSDEAFQNPSHYWPIRWLKMLARFPHDFGTWLGYGHTIPNGEPAEPLSPESMMNGVILLPLVRVNPGFLELRMDEERLLRFYCVVPLYEEEMNYKLKYGTDALTNKLDAHGINELIQLKRKNTCKTGILSFFKRK